ncbi:AlpA family transcriptional regulator [Pseudomonas syringae]|uniref:AlpA family transcriptional regulator n=1 Tax=Pseudomonas syringae TaxID=317 RepID=UPI001CA8726B|nr:AlpA family transcriptional regulator [Pseudomonas syringae]MCI3947102.1 AlpA family transcriptional regulator [Pseudomonas syringae]
METGFSYATTQRRILRLPEVLLRTGFKRAHIYSLINQGRFPQSVQLGPRAVGWDSLAVDKWIDDRIAGEPGIRRSLGGIV